MPIRTLPFSTLTIVIVMSGPICKRSSTFRVRTNIARILSWWKARLERLGGSVLQIQTPPELGQYRRKPRAGIEPARGSPFAPDHGKNGPSVAQEQDQNGISSSATWLAPKCAAIAASFEADGDQLGTPDNGATLRFTDSVTRLRK